MRATLVIPTLNEAASIAHVIRLFRTAAVEANGTLFQSDPVDWEVLVVDGASADGTGERLPRRRGPRARRAPQGYGRAYKTGFAAAKGELIATAGRRRHVPRRNGPRARDSAPLRTARLRSPGTGSPTSTGAR